MTTREEKNKKIRKKITKEENNKKVRKIVKIISIIFIIIFSIIAYGVFIGAKTFEVNEYKITNNKVPINFHGIKIVHISDILFNSLNKKDLNKIKDKVNKLEPDILVFTGNLKREDYNLEKDEIKTLENFFTSLNASIKKYAVRGINDDESFDLVMENSNFYVLDNQNELLYYKNNLPINITNNNETNENYYTICILSNPDELNNTNCNLALAGSNLGGEIKIPFYKGILTNYKYSDNYYKLNNTELYISNGLGNNYNIRLFNHPSINLYRLTTY